MFKLTIRDLLWFVLVAAMGVGWWKSTHQIYDELQRLRQQTRELRIERDAYQRLARQAGIID
jgi:hypothetical protein